LKLYAPISHLYEHRKHFWYVNTVKKSSSGGAWGMHPHPPTARGTYEKLLKLYMLIYTFLCI
jgi:hypothetical protein